MSSVQEFVPAVLDNLTELIPEVRDCVAFAVIRFKVLTVCQFPPLTFAFGVAENSTRQVSSKPTVTCKVKGVVVPRY